MGGSLRDSIQHRRVGSPNARYEKGGGGIVLPSRDFACPRATDAYRPSLSHPLYLYNRPRRARGPVSVGVESSVPTGSRILSGRIWLTFGLGACGPPPQLPQ